MKIIPQQVDLQVKFNNKINIVSSGKVKTQLWLNQTFSLFCMCRLIAKKDRWKTFTLNFMCLNSCMYITMLPLLLSTNDIILPEVIYSSPLWWVHSLYLVLLQVSKTPSPIINLCWWSCFLFHWKDERNRRKTPQITFTTFIYLIASALTYSSL